MVKIVEARGFLLWPQLASHQPTAFLSLQQNLNPSGSFLIQLSHYTNSGPKPKPVHLLTLLNKTGCMCISCSFLLLFVPCSRIVAVLRASAEGEGGGARRLRRGLEEAAGAAPGGAGAAGAPVGKALASHSSHFLFRVFLH